MSDLFGGDITDVQIFEESGILKHLNPYDIILADRIYSAGLAESSTSQCSVFHSRDQCILLPPRSKRLL